jgi:hypothetical protein
LSLATFGYASGWCVPASRSDSQQQKPKGKKIETKLRLHFIAKLCFIERLDQRGQPVVSRVFHANTPGTPLPPPSLAINMVIIRKKVYISLSAVSQFM